MSNFGEKTFFHIVFITVAFVFSYSLGNYPFNSGYMRLQSLDFGPCLPEGDNYCVHRVPNSFCLKEKNECFCKLGHVAIQEEHGISCKTLLSSLKCKVDGDCIHFLNSACHPGAGYCYCPSGTSLIIQERACHKLVKQSSSTFCRQCKSVGGICYQSTGMTSKSFNAYGSRWESTNISIYSGRNYKQEYGCSCPIPMGMIKQKISNSRNKQHNIGDPPLSLFHPKQLEFTNIQEPFCAAKLVDIGYYCNAFDVLCVSRNAICSLSPDSISMFRQCICDKDHIPVYEERLGYHECYHMLNATEPNCQLCSEVGETCYTMNLREPTRIGCTCTSVGRNGSMFENRLAADVALQLNAQSSTCSRQLAISCSTGQVNICYSLPRLRDSDQLLDAFPVEKILLAGRTGNHALSEECVMNLVDLDTHERAESQKWCRTLHFPNEQKTLPCGVSIAQHQSFTVYRGSIFVLRRQSKKEQKSIQQVNWTCSSRSNTPLFGTSMIDRQYNSDYYTYSRFHRNDPEPATTFVTANENGQPISEIEWGYPMKLVVNISKPSSSFKYIGIEECSVVPVTRNSQTIPLRIIHKGCPVSGSGFKGNFSNKRLHANSQSGALWSQQTNPVESSLFPAFHLNLLPNGKLVILNAPQRWKPSIKPDDATNVPEFIGVAPHPQTDPNVFTSSWYKNSITNMTYQKKSQNYDRIRQQLQFSCVYRICTSLLICSWVNQCGQLRDSSSTLVPNFREEARSLEFTTIEKSCKLNVVVYKPKIWRKLSSCVSQENCTKSLCITTKEIVVISSVTILIVGVLVFGILIWWRVPENSGSSRHTLKWMLPNPSEKSDTPFVDSVYTNNLFSESSEGVSGSMGYPSNNGAFDLCYPQKPSSLNMIHSRPMRSQPSLRSSEHVDVDLSSKLSNKANNWIALHEMKRTKSTTNYSVSDNPWIRKCEYAMNVPQMQCYCTKLNSEHAATNFTLTGDNLRTLHKADVSHTEENNWIVSRTLPECHTNVDLHEYPSQLLTSPIFVPSVSKLKEIRRL